MYVRTIKVRSSSGALNEYVRVVEAYRQDGKVKQRVIADLGRKDVLVALLPKLRRVLEGRPILEGQGDEEPEILDASTWGPVLVVRALFDELGLWEILDGALGCSGEGRWADRAFVLVANRLIHPRSEHGMAGWLETDFVCDRRGRRWVPWWHRRNRVRVHHRQLDAWYRTLDRLVNGQGKIERGLYRRLRDLFSLKPELVLYDITSTYFEGSGPEGLAKHGYSRDGKPHNVQVIVGVVMVAGWPIAHHVWEGNRVDHATVREVVDDLRRRFELGRVILVGDRGMVTEENLQGLIEEGQGYLVGLKRRRNAKLDRWLERIEPGKWIECPVGITAAEKAHPPRTRAQEVPSGEPGMRVFVIDSEERRQYEQAMRERAMERTREKLQKLQQRVASGKLVDAAKIGAAAERVLQAHHGYRYYTWRMTRGTFQFEESPLHFEREKRLEGKYVIATSEAALGVVEAVSMYKELMEVERGFRQMKDVLAMRPIWHRVAPRVRAHIFVAALALLVSRLLERRLQEAGVDLSAAEALQAVSTIRVVDFRLSGQPSTLGVRRGVSTGSPHARQVLKALGLTELKPPPAPPDEPTVV
jgi:transposase